MIPASFNLPDAYRGDSYGPLVLTFFRGTTPAIIEGYTPKCEVRDKRTKEVKVVWPSDTHGISLSGNQITLEAVPGEYMKFQPASYEYDFQMIKDGYTRTYLKGYFNLVDETTNY